MHVTLILIEFLVFHSALFWRGGYVLVVRLSLFFYVFFFVDALLRCACCGC
jgi:hypothetical protein